ncbi:MAG TPA: HisA/HisF-related TIM barrel protein [Terriglobia bacterium]|nr:HisA/HisF-related TIM barrel protein [Terriglobia bacterium]
MEKIATSARTTMIIPCIDLMGNKVVQLVQGRENAKALELPDPYKVLEKFSAFPEVQVIDLDAALGRPPQSHWVRGLCQRKPCRVGGGIRNVEVASEVLSHGALKVIIGSAAFSAGGVNHSFLKMLNRAIPRERLMIAVDCLNDCVAVAGWKRILPLRSGDAVRQLEPYCSEFLCTCIDVEGKLQGTDLNWFRKVRAGTSLPVTAAGGITTDEEIHALEEMGMNAALGMGIYRKMFPELFPAASAGTF